ncbi:MAG: protease complex subunit PrcB family protein [Rhodothermales bacterium]|nr:protease complex subunit PrcB family protein [Rhodothermales bacterium]
MIRNPVTLILVVATAAFAIGCSPRTTSQPDSDLPPEALYFETVGFGQTGAIADTTEAVFYDEASWRDAASQLRPREALGTVDFSQYMVILAALSQPTGGYRVEFNSVERQQEEIVASYTVYAPGGDCMTIAALTLPFQAVAVRRADGEVTFQRSVERESCSVD